MFLKNLRIQGESVCVRCSSNNIKEQCGSGTSHLTAGKKESIS